MSANEGGRASLEWRRGATVGGVSLLLATVLFMGVFPRPSAWRRSRSEPRP